jgi:hypothetical protein
MEYPWLDKFIFEAQQPEDTPPDEETGTNEPVNTTEENPDEQPDKSLAEDLTSTEDVLPDEVTPTDAGTSFDTSGLQSQIDGLKKKLEEIQKNFDLEEEINILKRKLENISVQDDTNLNDSIFQSACMKIKYIKRAVRRFLDKKARLYGKQQQLIETMLEQKPEMSSQEIAAQLTEIINMPEQDIIDFIRNSEFRFRHRRHGIEASIIDWKSLEV